MICKYEQWFPYQANRKGKTSNKIKKKKNCIIFIVTNIVVLQIRENELKSLIFMTIRCF